MKTVSGYVENITFRNEDNGFTVLTLSSGKEDITCTVRRLISCRLR